MAEPMQNKLRRDFLIMLEGSEDKSGWIVVCRGAFQVFQVSSAIALDI